MGRRRTTGCTARHWPDEICRACAAARAKRSRQRRRKRAASGCEVSGSPVAPAPRDPERAELDRQAAAHRDRLTKAYAMVNRAIRRGSIAPPTACERCDIPAIARSAKLRDPAQRAPRPRPRVALHAWLPDPAAPRAIAWLCTACRAHVRATREPLILRWVWPGMPPTKRGCPSLGDLPLHVAGAALERGRATAQRGLPRLAETLFFSALTQAAGERADALYVQGLRAALRGVRWAPVGDPELDALLERWVAHERARRESAVGDGVAITPVPVWERRARRDRLPPLSAEPKPVDFAVGAAFEEREALARLERAEAEYLAVMDRILAAVNQPSRRDLRKDVASE